MAWLGMNDETVAAQGVVLGNQAEAIQQLISKVDQEVQQLKQNWHGEDATKFEAEWTSTHRAELERARTLLTEMRTTIEREVSQQRSTSSSY